MESDEAEQWRNAMEEEESTLIKNHTWTEAILPVGRKAITAKIIFKRKRGANDGVNRYKARRLRKTLYGLKQSPRQWNKLFDQFLSKFNFASEADRCVYKGNVDGERALLALYVDDGLVMAKIKQPVNRITDYLQQKFEVTLGDAKVFVGIEIE